MPTEKLWPVPLHPAQLRHQAALQTMGGPPGTRPGLHAFFPASSGMALPSHTMFFPVLFSSATLHPFCSLQEDSRAFYLTHGHLSALAWFSAQTTLSNNRFLEFSKTSHTLLPCNPQAHLSVQVVIHNQRLAFLETTGSMEGKTTRVGAIEAEWICGAVAWWCMAELRTR